jgi:RNA recognition motif-containing protein
MVTDVYNTGKGFAFVTFDRKEDAETATMAMDGQTLGGQQIKVGKIKPLISEIPLGCPTFAYQNVAAYFVETHFFFPVLLYGNNRHILPLSIR